MSSTLPTSDSTQPRGLPAAGILDAEALERLQGLDPSGAAGLVARVLVTYTNSLQRLLDQLRVAREQADLQGQRHIVHTLKSSSASVGALLLSAQCAEIEDRLREGRSDGLAPKFDTLVAEGERLLAALRQA